MGGWIFTQAAVPLTCAGTAIRADGFPLASTLETADARLVLHAHGAVHRPL